MIPFRWQGTEYSNRHVRMLTQELSHMNENLDSVSEFADTHTHTHTASILRGKQNERMAVPVQCDVVQPQIKWENNEITFVRNLSLYLRLTGPTRTQWNRLFSNIFICGWTIHAAQSTADRWMDGWMTIVYLGDVFNSFPKFRTQ